MNTNIKVSILVPIYGVEEFIERCARNLFEQIYTNIEFVFVNDCTKDNSVEVLKKVMNDYPNIDCRVRIINHEHNRGLAAARNTAIEYCTGEYLMHVDSDDWLEKDAVEKCIDALSEDDYDIVYFDVKTYNKKGYEYYNIPVGIERELLLKKMLCGDTRTSIYGSLIRRKLYTENNISCKEGVNNSEDYQVSPKLLFFSPKIKSLGIALYNYERRNELSMTSHFSEKNSNQNWESIDIISSFFKQHAPEYIPFIEKRRLFACFGDIKACLLGGDHSTFYRGVVLKRIDSVDRQYWKSISFGKRVSFYLRNERLVKLYITIVVSIHDCFKKLNKSLICSI